MVQSHEGREQLLPEVAVYNIVFSRVIRILLLSCGQRYAFT